MERKNKAPNWRVCCSWLVSRHEVTQAAERTGFGLVPLDFRENLNALIHSIPPPPVGHLFPYVPFTCNQAGVFVFSFRPDARPNRGKREKYGKMKARRVCVPPGGQGRVRISIWTIYEMCLKLSFL